MATTGPVNTNIDVNVQLSKDPKGSCQVTFSVDKFYQGGVTFPLGNVLTFDALDWDQDQVIRIVSTEVWTLPLRYEVSTSWGAERNSSIFVTVTEEDPTPPPLVGFDTDIIVIQTPSTSTNPEFESGHLGIVALTENVFFSAWNGDVNAIFEPIVANDFKAAYATYYWDNAQENIVRSEFQVVRSAPDTDPLTWTFSTGADKVRGFFIMARISDEYACVMFPPRATDAADPQHGRVFRVKVASNGSILSEATLDLPMDAIDPTYSHAAYEEIPIYQTNTKPGVFCSWVLDRSDVGNFGVYGVRKTVITPTSMTTSKIDLGVIDPGGTEYTCGDDSVLEATNNLAYIEGDNKVMYPRDHNFANDVEFAIADCDADGSITSYFTESAFFSTLSPPGGHGAQNAVALSPLPGGANDKFIFVYQEGITGSDMKYFVGQLTAGVISVLTWGDWEGDYLSNRVSDQIAIVHPNHPDTMILSLLSNKNGTSSAYQNVMVKLDDAGTDVYISTKQSGRFGFIETSRKPYGGHFPLPGADSKAYRTEKIFGGDGILVSASFDGPPSVPGSKVSPASITVPEIQSDIEFISSEEVDGKYYFLLSNPGVNQQVKLYTFPAATDIGAQLELYDDDGFVTKLADGIAGIFPNHEEITFFTDAFSNRDYWFVVIPPSPPIAGDRFTMITSLVAATGTGSGSSGCTDDGQSSSNPLDYGSEGDGEITVETLDSACDSTSPVYMTATAFGANLVLETFAPSFGNSGNADTIIEYYGDDDTYTNLIADNDDKTGNTYSKLEVTDSSHSGTVYFLVKPYNNWDHPSGENFNFSLSSGGT